MGIAAGYGAFRFALANTVENHLHCRNRCRTVSSPSFAGGRIYPRLRAHFTPRIVQKVCCATAITTGFRRLPFERNPAAVVAKRLLAGLLGLLISALIICWLSLHAFGCYQLAG